MPSAFKNPPPRRPGVRNVRGCERLRTVRQSRGPHRRGGRRSADPPRQQQRGHWAAPAPGSRYIAPLHRYPWDDRDLQRRWTTAGGGGAGSQAPGAFVQPARVSPFLHADGSGPGRTRQSALLSGPSPCWSTPSPWTLRWCAPGSPIRLATSATGPAATLMMAMAAWVAVAEAERVVPLGGIDPNDVTCRGPLCSDGRATVTPSRSEPCAHGTTAAAQGWTPSEMTRACHEIAPGMVVNLGHPGGGSRPLRDVWLQSENGLLGMGPYPRKARKTPAHQRRERP